MNVLRKTLRRTLSSTAPMFLLVVSLMLGGATIPVFASEPTQVFVDPATQTISAQETFTITVSCIPSQPIKSFELKISFNPSLLHANSVSEGNIFTGHTTFFNPGTINNVAGTIINIYDLIIGTGNVSAPGDFVIISFTAKTVSEMSVLDLSNVGVTNEVGYVSLSVSDGSVTVLSENQPPGGGGYTPPDENNEQPPTSNENTPPHSPAQPTGPTFIEREVSYSYSSSGFDPDGDSIRLRFDWGDGSFSNWSVFVSANTSVSSSYTWSSLSSFSVRVIAQDENSTNSSWSVPLMVTVSENQGGDWFTSS